MSDSDNSKSRKKNIICGKCASKQKENIYQFSCSHNICSNCIFHYFISNNFQGLNLKSIDVLCPLCQKGDNEFSLNDWINLTKKLIHEKNPNISTEPSLSKIDTNLYCTTHQEREVLKYCTQCKIFLCDICLDDVHDRFYPNHTLIDKKKFNDKKNDVIKSSYKYKELPNNSIEYNKIKEYLKETEKIFYEKIEDEYNAKKSKIEEIIRKFTLLLNNYDEQMNIFQNKMKKIFHILNLSYYNYFINLNKDKKEITIPDELLEVKFLQENIDLNEITNICLKKIQEIENKNNLFNFELIWSKTDFKKDIILKPKKEEEDEDIKKDCVTKIIELKKSQNIASSLINGQIHIWDIESKSVKFCLNAHKSSIWCILELKNGMLCSGSSDTTIKIWDIINQNEKFIYNLKGHKSTIFCLSEIKTNNLLSGSGDKTIRLWDLLKQQCLLILNNEDSKVSCILPLHDNNFFLAGGDDNTIKIWNLNSLYVPNILIGHDCTVWCLCEISDDDVLFASGSSDNVIKIWDLNLLKCLFTLEGHENTISSLKLLKNNLLASSSWDKTAKIWNLNNKSCVYTLRGHKDIVWDIIELSNGNLATCSNDKSIIIWTKN